MSGVAEKLKAKTIAPKALRPLPFDLDIRQFLSLIIFNDTFLPFCTVGSSAIGQLFRRIIRVLYLNISTNLLLT